MMRSRSAGQPCRCTAMTSFVCGVIFASKSPGSRLNDSSISAKTGSAPESTMVLKQECQVQAGRITSSPGPMHHSARMVQVERFVDLGKDRQRSGEHDGVEAGVPGPGRQDHFVARADAERRQGAVQRGGSRRYGERVAGTHPGGELLLEGGHLHGRLGAWAVPPEWTPGLQHVHNFLPLFLVVVQWSPEVGPQRRAADGRFALDCADPDGHSCQELSAVEHDALLYRKA